MSDACHLCPRDCGAHRSRVVGACGAGAGVVVSRAALHFWEEPPVSGSSGSGTVFFSGCPLRCVYCQNAEIAYAASGLEISVGRLAAIMSELEGQGALNINCVTATPFIPQVERAVSLARSAGMALPIVWNTSSYETVESVSRLAGTVDVWLADLKYAGSDIGRRYSRAADYPDVAIAAIDRMLEQAGEPCYDEYRGQTRLVSGVCIRHLLLPGNLEDSKRVVDIVADRYGDRVLLSLMSQYTPVVASAARSGDKRAMDVVRSCPELALRVTDAEYEELLDYADERGLDGYFWQDGGAAEESFVPAWDHTGVLEPAGALPSDGIPRSAISGKNGDLAGKTRPLTVE